MSRLFEAINIEKLLIKNRITVPPMVCFTYVGENGYVTDENIRHYREIAEGGAGLIIQEATCISFEGRLGKTQIGIWEDAQIDGLKKIVDAVHKEGAKIFVQIHHAGIMGVAEHLDCPSDYVFASSNGKDKIGHEMSTEQIELVKSQFMSAFRRAKSAGYDGIELHGCHNYLISQFLNKNVNKREDKYGQNPVLFATELMTEASKLADDDFVVGIRLGGFEPELEDSIFFAKELEKAGAQFLDISSGFSSEDNPRKPDGFPFHELIYAAGEIKKHVNIPVFAVREINSAEKAEAVLEKTGVDMVDIGRGILVNKNWTNDAMARKDVGTCIYCKVCFWRIDPSKCPGHLNYIKAKTI